MSEMAWGILDISGGSVNEQGQDKLIHRHACVLALFLKRSILLFIQPQMDSMVFLYHVFLLFAVCFSVSAALG